MAIKERKALGKGFSALLKPIEDDEQAIFDQGVIQLKINDVAVNPKQPRREINQEKLEELSQSIKYKGVLQPVLVRKKEINGKNYELVAGERRLKASKLAGFEMIPALVKEIKDQDLLEIALIENIQRDNLNPIEESLAYSNLLKEHGYTQEDLAKRVGKARSAVANSIRLLQLPEQIRTDLIKENLSTGHARPLLGIKNEDDLNNIREKIINDKISVRQTEELVRLLKEKNPIKTKNQPEENSISSQMNLNQERLSECFDRKVTIKPMGEKGKIVLEYYNTDDFNRLFTKLLKSK
ncbi:MAG: ParB/RepB/Spo0J family partition protein [Deltaproteobacteria bacterium]|jgi:ParB family transcriptional regulator, chromosome partitioning protein|nr:ParB/RepB/Spo0J family partition protein [Deltaproteobacteria bacterium]MBT4527343.1 ParB/RepB/Spo0J family partition protein [Deltaproteobacteria bacterium]